MGSDRIPSEVNHGRHRKRWKRRISITFLVLVAIVAIFFLAIIGLISLDIYFETVGRDARHGIYSEAAPVETTKPDENRDTQ